MLNSSKLSYLKPHLYIHIHILMENVNIWFIPRCSAAFFPALFPLISIRPTIQPLCVRLAAGKLRFSLLELKRRGKVWAFDECFPLKAKYPTRLYLLFSGGKDGASPD